MQEQLFNYIENMKGIIEEFLNENLQYLDVPVNLKNSMLYSIEAGGKRIRPILLIASFEAYRNFDKKVLSSAAALEMIHTYSLIHDDLPAMDDDDYRRGRLTNHKYFDEATAILAGDALLTYSFEIVANDLQLTDQEKTKILMMLSKCSGPKGMVGGQIMDMEAENQSVSIEELETIHTLKTGKLIEFAIYTGAYLANASNEQLNHLMEFSYYLGLIFQVQDDILDITGTVEKLGKPVGSDEENIKSTYPKLMGMEGALEIKEQYVQKAKEALRKANASDSMLMELIDYFSNRDH